MWRTLSPLVIASSLALGCGDDGAPIADAGARDGGGFADGAVEVTAPAIPWLDVGVPPIAAPMWMPCPAGWRDVVEDDAAYCEPFALDVPEAACGPGEAHLPGTPGCAPVGASCPTGPFAPSLPAGAVHVRAGAAARGDGSATSPFATLAEVPWASLGDGSTVALAKGTYDGVLPLAPGVSVVGACAAETIVTGRADPSRPLVELTGAGSSVATVRDVTLADSGTVAVLVRGGQSLSLEGAVIERMADTAVYGMGAGQISLRRVVIRDAVAPTAPDALLRGIIAIRGATIDAHEVSIERVFLAGVYLQDAASRVALEDSAVRETGGQPSTGEHGYGALVSGAGTLSLTRTYLAGNRSASILAQGSEARVDLDTVVVRDTLRPVRGVVQSNAVVADMGASVDAQKILVDRHLEYAVIATNGGTATVADAVLRGGRMSTSARSGRGLGVNHGSSLTARRVRITDFDGTGVNVFDPGTTALLEDVRVRDPADTGSGFGVFVAGGALEASRLVVERTRAVGLHLVNAGTTVRLSDAAFLDIQPAEKTALLGEGLDAQFGASLTASRILISNVHRIGFAAFHEGTTVTVDDMVVRDTESEAAGGLAGHGVYLGLSASGTMSRLRVERSRHAGIALNAARLAATDTVIDGVRREACTESCPPDSVSAYGALAVQGASLTLSRFRVNDAEVCGVFLSDTGEIDLASGVISGSLIGACVQVDGYDLARLSTDVAYVDNGTNLESTSLPVPEPIDIGTLAE